MKKYTKDHEWLEQVAGTLYKVGITDYAQEQLGDVVLVELPEVGMEVSVGDDMAVIESVKAASDVYAPVGGKITSVNDKLPDEPTLVNEAAEGDAWLVEITLADESELDGLMDEIAYKELIAKNE